MKTAKSSSARQRLRVRAGEPADLLAVVPYLLGFHPTESLVVVFARDRRVALSARVDLPPPEAVDAVPQLVEMILDLSRRHAVDQVGLIGYSDAGTASALVAGIKDGLPRRLWGTAIVADGRRWWPASAATGPAEGTPYEVASHPIAAAAVYAGLAARDDRQQVADQVAGPAVAELPMLTDLASAVAAELAGHGAAGRARSFAGRLRSALADPDGLDDRAAVTLATLVTDLRLRDCAWASITTEEASTHCAVWSRVCGRVPSELAAAPICLAGLAAWAGGDGALLNCCCERLEREHPDYSLGWILADISRRALPPSMWEEWGAALRQELPVLAG